MQVTPQSDWARFWRALKGKEIDPQVDPEVLFQYFLADRDDTADEARIDSSEEGDEDERTESQGENDSAEENDKSEGEADT